MLQKIHHIAIICSDYERSKTFYVNVLSLKIIQEAYRAARQSYKLDLAFEVDDLDLEVRRLSAKGFNSEPIRVDEYTGKRFTFFSDPDDLPIEYYAA